VTAEFPGGGARPAPERVRTALAARGLVVEVVEFTESTRTAEEAARAVGATVGQIVKSLVFVADGRPVLVLTSGANRVDLKKVARLAGASRVEKATPEMTRAATGFSIGGVPPVGHQTPLPVFVDEALLRFTVVYAAAGTRRGSWRISPSGPAPEPGAIRAQTHFPGR